MTSPDLRNRVVQTLKHPTAAKAYTFAAVVFAFSAGLYHQQPEIGYGDRIVRWGLPAGSVAYASLRLWAAEIPVLPRIRAAADLLIYSIRNVTVRLSIAKARSATLALVVVTSMVVGGLALDAGPLPASDTVAADDHLDGDDTYENWEDGNTNGWGLSNIQAQTNVVYEGTYSGSLGASESDQITIPDHTSGNITEAVRYTNLDYPVIKLNTESSIVRDFRISPDGTVEYYDGSWINTSIVLTTDQWYKIEFDPNYASNTLDMQVETKDGSKVGSDTGIPFDSGSSYIDKLRFESGNNGGMYVGVLGEVPDGVEVSGSLTNANENPIESGTLELRQNDSVVDSTTTNNNGGYSFATVQDGDYTVRASASGYQNKTKSITVSGSPVTVDFSLFEEDSYKQIVELSDQTGKFNGQETSVITFRYTGDGPPGSGPFYDKTDWTWVDTKQFNWQNLASVRLQEGETYAFAVTDGSTRRFNPAGPLYEYVGFVGGEGPNPHTLRIRDQEESDTVVAAEGDNSTVTTYEGNETNLSDIDYNITRPDGGEIYTGGIEYPDDDPTTDYQSEVNDDLVSDLLNESGADPDTEPESVEYNGTTGSGESLNGTTEIFDSFPGFTSTNDTGGAAFGPTGSGGSGPSTGQTIVGVGLLAGGGFLAFRRFGPEISNAVSNLRG